MDWTDFNLCIIFLDNCIYQKNLYYNTLSEITIKILGQNPYAQVFLYVSFPWTPIFTILWFSSDIACFFLSLTICLKLFNTIAMPQWHWEYVIDVNVFCMPLCATPTIWGQYTSHNIPESSMLGHFSAEIKRLTQGHRVPEKSLLWVFLQHPLYTKAQIQYLITGYIVIM